MSVFDSFSKKALTTTQGFFGENVKYKRGSEETDIKAVFQNSEVEISGYITQSLTAEVLSSDLSLTPQKGDKLIRGSKTYSIDSSIESDGVLTLVLKEG